MYHGLRFRIDAYTTNDDNLFSTGVKTSQVMDHLVDQAGGYASVDHTKKDLQNRTDAEHRTLLANSDADAIIVYEKVKAYSWILKMFLLAMHGKYPISVVIDGNKTVQFENKWHSTLDIFGLHENEWVKKMYAKHKQLKLYKFMRQVNRSMTRLHHNEMKDDFKHLNEHPILVTHLVQLEKHATEVYARGIFQLVRDEIKEEAKLSICALVLLALSFSECGSLSIGCVSEMKNSSRQLFKTPEDCHFNAIVTQRNHISALSMIDMALSNLDDRGQQKEKFLQSCFCHFMRMQCDMKFSGLLAYELLLREIWHNGPRDEMRFRLGQHTMLRLIDDLEPFNAFPWGSDVYSHSILSYIDAQNARGRAYKAKHDVVIEQLEPSNVELTQLYYEGLMDVPNLFPQDVAISGTRGPNPPQDIIGS
ncbi:hypothetical protein JRO89_XS11G0085400 [Xanthoceras sorbifolium]|uniref:Uncharacterized protein n=1 Tax=Xanthoceras sorbifolium TaxID=99658 RepID=A0ABQ8HF76_9ROSI|nr:hypothetical protein JRO89_XS11G0085400 [Xanthoceras sorbifolium]